MDGVDRLITTRRELRMAEETTKKTGRLVAALLAGSALVFSSVAAGLPDTSEDENQDPQITTQAPESSESAVSTDEATPVPAEDNASADATPEAPAGTDDASAPEEPEPVDDPEAPETPQNQATPTATTQSTATPQQEVESPELQLNVSEGEVGDTVNVVGLNFVAGNTVELTFEGSGESIALSTVTVENDGSFTVPVTIPAVDPGNYNIVARDAVSSSAVAFTVVEQESDEVELSLNLYPGAGPVGTQFNLSGGGYTENGNVEISMAPQGGESIVSTTTQADGGGWISDATLTVPSDATAGLYDVSATDEETGETQTAVFNVTNATLEIDPKTISEDDFRDRGVTLTVAGLEAEESVEFHFGGPYSSMPDLEGEATADTGGVAEYVVTGGENIYVGTYNVTVRQAESQAAVVYGQFEVTSEDPQVNAYPADPTEDGAVRQGETLIVTGYNVTADATVTMDFGIDGVDAVQVETDDSGYFGVEFDVPLTTVLGDKEVTVTDNETDAVGTDSYTVAQADEPVIGLDTEQAYPGDDIRVTGAGFSPAAPLEININPTLAEITANDAGAFDTVVTLPENLAPGEYEITVVNQNDADEAAVRNIEILAADDAAVEASLTITPERIELDDFIGDPDEGAGVTHVVDGLEPGTTVTYAISGPEYVNDFESTRTANDDGVVSFVIHGFDVANPAVYLGDYTTVVTYEDDEGETQTLSGSFTVVDSDGTAGGDSDDSEGTGGSTTPVDINGVAGLAQTGATGVNLGFLAGGLLLAGATLVAFANRRRLFGRTA